MEYLICNLFCVPRSVLLDVQLIAPARRHPHTHTHSGWSTRLQIENMTILFCTNMSDCCCLACQNNGNTHITNEKSCHRRLTLSEYLAIGVGFQIIFHLGFLMGARVIKRKSLNLRVTFLRLLIQTHAHHTRYNCVIYFCARFA